MTQITQVLPMLVYEDIQTAHDFLVTVFGFESGGVEKLRSGEPVHAEARGGQTTVWLHPPSRQHRMEAPSSPRAESSTFVVLVDYVDAHFSRSQAAGSAIESSPEDKPYGQREYGARDSGGHLWWFATPL